MKRFIAVTIYFLISFTQSAHSQITCDEEKIKYAEDIRRTAENSLYEARLVNVTLSFGTELTAFYFNNRLVKISTTDNLSHSEQIFFDNHTAACYESSGYENGKEYFNAYYLSENSIFCKQNKLTGAFVEIINSEVENIYRIIEEYLLAIQ